jgi:hypothetical protein
MPTSVTKMIRRMLVVVPRLRPHVFALIGCTLLNGCVSIQTKSELPKDWLDAMRPSGSADISGEYAYRGEGRLVPDNRITAFPPVPDYLPEATWIFRQVSPNLVEVRNSRRSDPVISIAVDSDPKTGEVTVPSFSKPDSSLTSIKVVFVRGRDGALYAKRTNVSAGLGELLPIPAAGVLTRWCRFLPVRP